MTDTARNALAANDAPARVQALTKAIFTVADRLDSRRLEHAVNHGRLLGAACREGDRMRLLLDDDLASGGEGRQTQGHR